jgi:hypothetical protein
MVLKISVQTSLSSLFWDKNLRHPQPNPMKVY